MNCSFLLEHLEKVFSLRSTLQEKIATRIGARVIDLLLHFPLRYEKRSWCSRITELKPGQKSTLVLQVLAHEKRPRQYNIMCTDGNELIRLVYFRGYTGYLLKMLPVGHDCLVTGMIESFKGQKQIVHPDHVGKPSEKGKWVGIEAIYPLVTGVTQRQMQQWIRVLLERSPSLDEWIREPLKVTKKWPSWHEALEAIHAPQNKSEEEIKRAEERIAFDELFAHQLGLALMRRFHQEQEGISFQTAPLLRETLLKNLPYDLTESQKKVIDDIEGEMNAKKRMISLLMGDVGSGKTIVSLFAALHAIEAGYQVAVLAPTEILSVQHFKVFSSFLEPLGIRIGLFTGRNTKKERTTLEAQLKTGEIDLAIGTHALLENPVLFKKLGFVVIDEQHRFGVAQRLQLIEKGGRVDVLVMSATPIPRTLLLAYYGELSVHKITEKPKDRLPITTVLFSKNRINEIYERLKNVILKGERVYWICPLIEESETMSMGYALERFEHLNASFKGEVGLLHGKLSPSQKEEAMGAFRDGNTPILIATTVVEVGVDVPEATVIVIEHAERFGMAQLHQLRGRVGRSHKPSFAVLLYEEPLSEIAQKRLTTLRAESDGFKIAEADLKIRGGGDPIGFKQSGMPTFKVADPYTHLNMLEEAREEAHLLTEQDPFLLSQRGQNAKLLLSLFGHDTAISTLKGG